MNHTQQLSIRTLKIDAYVQDNSINFLRSYWITNGANVTNDRTKRNVMNYIDDAGDARESFNKKMFDDNPHKAYVHVNAT